MSRPPNREFQECWNKQREKQNDVFSSSENPSFFSVKIHTAAAATEEGTRTRCVRQTSFVRFHQICNSLSNVAARFVFLLRTANRRIALPPPAPYKRADSLLYRVIKGFLFTVVLMLIFELVAYFNGWHLSPPSLHKAEVLGMVELVYATWLRVRAEYLAHPLKSLANVCIVLFLVQFVDWFLLMLGCFWIKLRGIKPVGVVEYPNGDLEGQNPKDYPMVLIQIPMCNEREVYQHSIGAVCVFDWPKERMLVQVLDDSDDLEVQSLIKAEVQKWQQHGVRIVYRHRLIRSGSRKRKSAPQGKPKEFPTSPAQNEDDSIVKKIKSNEDGDNAESDRKPEGDSSKESNSSTNQKPPEPPKDYSHVRTWSGQTTDSHSLAERVRREKINERMKLLQDLVPGCSKVTGKALMLEEIINYVKSLQRQVEFLSMKLASKNPSVDFNTSNPFQKDIFQPNCSLQTNPIYPLDPLATTLCGAYHHHQNPLQQNGITGIGMGPLNQSHVKKLPPIDEFIIGVNEASQNEDDSIVKKIKSKEDGDNAESDRKPEGDSSKESNSSTNQKPPEPPKDYIHVSLAERVRREKINERMKLLQDLVPGCSKVTGKALMLEEIINYVKSLQRQVEFLSVKLASINPSVDFNTSNPFQKDIFQPNCFLQTNPIYPLDPLATTLCGAHHHHQNSLQQNGITGIGMGPLNQSHVEKLPPIDEFINGVHEATQNEDGSIVKKIKSNEDGDNAESDWKPEGDSGKESNSSTNQKPPEPPKDYIHVRARRGQATDSHSRAERVRREKISERMKLLQDLVPGCSKVTGKARVLKEIINYVKSLQCQVEICTKMTVDLISSNHIIQVWITTN